jgi:VIT family protein
MQIVIGESARQRRRPLEPLDRISEVLFGLIMVLTVTCSFSVVEASHRDVHGMLLAALGCNLAWGVIDAVLYLLQRFGEQGRGIVALRVLRKTTDKAEAREIISESLPPFLASALSPAEFEEIWQRLVGVSESPKRPELSKDDWLAALGIFLLVFLSTFPVVVPFLLFNDAKLALRTSNGVAIALLLTCGYALGGYAGRRRWLTGFVMVLLGGGLVGIAMVLGG